jgi:hypothetical protein
MTGSKVLVGVKTQQAAAVYGARPVEESVAPKPYKRPCCKTCIGKGCVGRCRF